MIPNRFSTLVVPGVGNSGAEHWQTLWDRQDADARRIAVSDWDRPNCETWVEAIDDAVLTMGDSVVIVAHSLGCLAVVHWAARHPRRLHAALLVAVPDPAGPAFF